MDYLPVFLRLEGKPALVVGGGQVAARKADWLLKARARVTLVAPRLVPALAAHAANGQLRHLESGFAPQQLEGAVVVVAASDDGALNAAVAAAARTRRIPVNVVDSAELSTFIFPAIIDRSPVVVAVSSAGAAPVLARRVRQQIEALLPARLGALARFLGGRRAAVRRALGPHGRRAFWERIVAGPAALEVLAGNEAAAEQRFGRELRAAGLVNAAGGSGEVYLIGAGPGDPDLLTLRALQLLQQADVILHDRLVPEAILERARRDARRVFVGKESGEAGGQKAINEQLVSLARAGLKVARLKGGDGYVFGRGGEELEILREHGIPYRVVPGITAALGAAACADIPLTHRRLAHSVTLVSGHAAADDSLDWRALAGAHQTVVFYMGVAQLPRIVARLRAAGASPGRAAAIVERATLPGERVLRSPLGEIAALATRAQVAAPALLIVGEVAALASSAIAAESGAVPASAECAERALA